MNLTVVVLAAGLGSRFGGLKQLAPLGPNGETLLDYALFDALRYGFTRLVFVVRREFEADFHTRIGRNYARQAEVTYVYQDLDRLPMGCKPTLRRRKPWGTGHAVWCACAELSDPFAIINADDFYGAASYRQAASFLGTVSVSVGGDVPQSACLIGYRLKQTLSPTGPVSRGVCMVDPQGFLQTIDEVHGLSRSPTGAIRADAQSRAKIFTGDEVVSMNFWGLTPAIFPALTREFSVFLAQQEHDATAEFYLPAAINSMIICGEMRVQVLPVEGEWFGVTYREDLPRAAVSLRNLINASNYPSRL
jgi:UTP-glucose-1-phosphate uridylyltransferase